MVRIIFLVALLFRLSAPAEAVILWDSHAEAGTCNTLVPFTVWDYRDDGVPSTAQMDYKCDTPVPNSGKSKYFQVDTVQSQQSAWNKWAGSTVNINLTPGNTYYFGLFHRVDRINGLEVFVTNANYRVNKSLELNGTIRLIIEIGWQDFVFDATVSVANKFTHSSYLSPQDCTGCIYEQMAPNVAPYSRQAPFLCDYERWYAAVLAVTPSNGATTNGRIQFWINGIKTHDYQNIKTQDVVNPNINTFQLNSTIGQPAYDTPPHLIKMGYFMFADTLADIENAGLMSDPEPGGGGGARGKLRRMIIPGFRR